MCSKEELIFNRYYKDIPTNPCKEIILNKEREMISATDDLIDSMTMTMQFINCSLDYNKEEINTNWEFHSSADDDINWKDIKDSLSYNEPLALVTRKYRDYNEEVKYVVLNKQLVNKADLVGMLDMAPDSEAVVSKYVHEIEGNFSDWVEWAKIVKAAKWPTGIKSTLKVILPTV